MYTACEAMQVTNREQLCLSTLRKNAVQDAPAYIKCKSDISCNRGEKKPAQCAGF